VSSVITARIALKMMPLVELVIDDHMNWCLQHATVRSVLTRRCEYVKVKSFFFSILEANDDIVRTGVGGLGEGDNFAYRTSTENSIWIDEGVQRKLIFILRNTWCGYAVLGMILSSDLKRTTRLDFSNVMPVYV